MTGSTCTVDNCTSPVKARGWCNRHYIRWFTHGDPETVRPAGGGPCAIDGCEDRSVARGWCLKHYTRWKRTGDPLRVRHVIGATAEDHFWSKVDKDSCPSGCWLWTGRLTVKGYGRIRHGQTLHRAHRFAYELLVGPIPEGLEIDHVWDRGCRHRHCVNPAHLEAVTGEENLRRRDQAAADARHLCTTRHTIRPIHTADTVEPAEATA